MLLALDLGMRTGWSLWTSGGRLLASGVWRLGKDHGRGRFGELLLRLRARVGAHGVKVVAYEHVHHHTGNDAAHVYGGWLAVLDMLAHLTGVELVPITTPEIHAIAGVKRATSPRVEGQADAERRAARATRRKENKTAIVAAARARGWLVADDNEAEACFCGAAALAKRTGSV